MDFTIWFLIGAALVFFMQAGFAMVETGFTRAKNAGNIIMKNLMDFCLGTVAFMLLGAGLMLGQDALFGLIGLPNMDIFTKINDVDVTKNFVFNLVFCATAATIVSGAMAERTKFVTYCIYSVLISLVVYPIEAHWVWGGGWLSQLGFIDFAGSAAIHMVGGVTAFIGAAIEGARIGKYKRDAKGKVLAVNAIPGHNIVIGALGVFILWFGWYGFNGAAATTTAELARIFVTTTIAPAVATVTTMLFTWFKNKKPDVSMCLNGALAGLVGITAGCLELDALGATIVGIVAGILVVVGVEFIDKVLHVDDPVGAVAVHGLNGIWGTLAVGLLSTNSGLFYTGSFAQLGIQALGIVSICAWTILMMTGIFMILKKTIGIRVSAEEEIGGLDLTEHGLASAYDGFSFAPDTSLIDPPVVSGVAPMAASVPVVHVAEVEGEVKATTKKSAKAHKITKVDIVMKQSRFEVLKAAMNDIGVTGMTVTQVLGCGTQKGASEYYRGVKMEINLLPKIKVEIVVSKVPVTTVIDTARACLYTGHIGDGKIFVYDVENVVKVRTGATGFDALQDE